MADDEANTNQGDNSGGTFYGNMDTPENKARQEAMNAGLTGETYHRTYTHRARQIREQNKQDTGQEDLSKEVVESNKSQQQGGALTTGTPTNEQEIALLQASYDPTSYRMYDMSYSQLSPSGQEAVRASEITSKDSYYHSAQRSAGNIASGTYRDDKRTEAMMGSAFTNYVSAKTEGRTDTRQSVDTAKLQENTASGESSTSSSSFVGAPKPKTESVGTTTGLSPDDKFMWKNTDFTGAMPDKRTGMEKSMQGMEGQLSAWQEKASSYDKNLNIGGINVPVFGTVVGLATFIPATIAKTGALGYVSGRGAVAGVTGDVKTYTEAHDVVTAKDTTFMGIETNRAGSTAVDVVTLGLPLGKLGKGSKAIAPVLFGGVTTAESLASGESIPQALVKGGLVGVGVFAGGEILGGHSGKTKTITKNEPLHQKVDTKIEPPSDFGNKPVIDNRLVKERPLDIAKPTGNKITDIKEQYLPDNITESGKDITKKDKLVSNIPTDRMPISSLSYTDVRPNVEGTTQRTPFSFDSKETAIKKENARVISNVMTPQYGIDATGIGIKPNKPFEFMREAPKSKSDLPRNQFEGITRRNGESRTEQILKPREKIKDFDSFKEKDRSKDKNKDKSKTKEREDLRFRDRFEDRAKDKYKDKSKPISDFRFVDRTKPITTEKPPSDINKDRFYYKETIIERERIIDKTKDTERIKERGGGGFFPMGLPSFGGTGGGSAYSLKQSKGTGINQKNSILTATMGSMVKKPKFRM